MLYITAMMGTGVLRVVSSTPSQAGCVISSWELPDELLECGSMATPGLQDEGCPWG